MGEVVPDGKRPRFIFNPFNDAWFGAWGPPQHLAQARLRALEKGLPVLRSTPTGISAVIDSNGNLLGNVPWRTVGAVDSVLPSPKPPTMFARAGNIMPFLFAFLLVSVTLAVRREHPDQANGSIAEVYLESASNWTRSAFGAEAACLVPRQVERRRSLLHPMAAADHE